MRYKIEIAGIRPIIMHNGAAGLDTRSAANLEKKEINRKKGSLRTTTDEDRLAELECQTSLWLNFKTNEPEIHAGAIRKAIETGARKLKQAQTSEKANSRKHRRIQIRPELGHHCRRTREKYSIHHRSGGPEKPYPTNKSKFDEWGLVFTWNVKTASYKKNN